MRLGIRALRYRRAEPILCPRLRRSTHLAAQMRWRPKRSRLTLTRRHSYGCPSRGSGQIFILARGIVHATRLHYDRRMSRAR